MANITIIVKLCLGKCKHGLLQAARCKTGIKVKYVEVANLLTDSLVYLCRSCRGITIKLRLFHSQ